ncbi:hypothetical protein [Leuconostoc suionicum]|uniref:hypothetical protein n=1 Tax=Leuconostoc suionicum TaxID=1511761 RepID=UPI00233EB5F8|nr:hypothetical protein [Leuconostoc suionicum]MDC2804849.1 hypothetical protein [Leuconostoc suionicum]MDC2822361.1 hypothetical protein [Leuconostoc suionicum]
MIKKFFKLNKQYADINTSKIYKKYHNHLDDIYKKLLKSNSIAEKEFLAQLGVTEDSIFVQQAPQKAVDTFWEKVSTASYINLETYQSDFGVTFVDKAFDLKNSQKSKLDDEGYDINILNDDIDIRLKIPNVELIGSNSILNKTEESTEVWQTDNNSGSPFDFSWKSESNIMSDISKYAIVGGS